MRITRGLIVGLIGTAIEGKTAVLQVEVRRHEMGTLGRAKLTIHPTVDPIFRTLEDYLIGCDPIDGTASSVLKNLQLTVDAAVIFGLFTVQ